MAKVPVVLLPGLLCTAGLFIHQINALKDHAAFLVPDISLDTDIQAAAKRILDTVPFDRFALGGLSMGGYIAFEIMRQAPERVASLALMDTSATPDTEAVKNKRIAMMEIAREEGLAAIIDTALVSIVSPEFQDNPDLHKILSHMAQTIGVQGYINQQKTVMSRPDSRPLLPLITCPTLVFGGQLDMLTPPEKMKEMAEAIPHALHAVIAGAGHLSPLENPSAVTALMRILIQHALN